jgi:predicted transcriptional regulator YdeE
VFEKSYIVRIYRCEKDKPRRFVGVVEEVGIPGRKAFKNIEELWDILTSLSEKSPHVNKDTEKP